MLDLNLGEVEKWNWYLVFDSNMDAQGDTSHRYNNLSEWVARISGLSIERRATKQKTKALRA